MRRIHFPTSDMETARSIVELLPAMGQGGALGGLTGGLGGLVAIALPVLGGGALSLAGAGVGGWLSGMVGTDLRDRRISKFSGAIESGHVLTMADLPRSRVEEVEAIIVKHHPDAECEGTEPTIPPFP